MERKKRARSISTCTLCVITARSTHVYSQATLTAVFLSRHYSNFVAMTGVYCQGNIFWSTTCRSAGISSGSPTPPTNLFIVGRTVGLIVRGVSPQYIKCIKDRPMHFNSIGLLLLMVVRSIPTGVVGFFIDIKSFRSHYVPGVDSASNRNEYQEHFLGVKAAGA